MSTLSCCKKGDLLLDKFPEKKEELNKYIDEHLADCHPDRKRGLLIQSLHKAQELYGYLPSSIQCFISGKLDLHLVEVSGVISFYSYFTDKPVGKFKINICTGTACFVKGADKILAEFSRYLNLENGETSKDLKFSMGGLRCVGACSLAPVVMVNDKVYGNVTTKMVPEIIDACK